MYDNGAKTTTMIIEYTGGQFIMGVGIIMLAIAIIFGYRNEDDADKIMCIVLSIFGIIAIIAGLNMDYGFLVFKLVDWWCLPNV